MKITTLQDTNRQIELTPHECDILKQVATYLRDNFNDLEFSLRDFSLEEIQEALAILERYDSDKKIYVTNNEANLFIKIFSEVSALVADALIEENEDLINIPQSLFILLFDSLAAEKIRAGAR
jgi:hypothetical protein